MRNGAFLDTRNVKVHVTKKRNWGGLDGVDLVFLSIRTECEQVVAGHRIASGGNRE